MICKISMQNCTIQDLFDILFSYICYDTVSTYDTIIFFIVNYNGTSTFYMYGMHDKSCDTTILTSLSTLLGTRVLYLVLLVSFWYYAETTALHGHKLCHVAAANKDPLIVLPMSRE
jgi:hypothetical protein